VGLFDRYRNIRPWLFDSGATSGSGCWGTKLSVGNMLYVEDVLVKEEVCSCFFRFLCVAKLDARWAIFLLDFYSEARQFRFLSCPSSQHTLDKRSSSFSDHLLSPNTNSRRTPADLVYPPAYA
jgi:hypothetical protein